MTPPDEYLEREAEQLRALVGEPEEVVIKTLWEMNQARLRDGYPNAYNRDTFHREYELPALLDERCGSC